MDVNKINDVILNQLNCVDGLYSLKLQNHIYGCFLIMEDIAQDIISLSDLKITYSNKLDSIDFDLDNNFSDIGLKYGFIMDERLRLDTFSPEYKNVWLECFKTIDLLHDVSSVDTIEDSVIELLTNCIPPRYAFFINALDTGSLTDDWVARVLKLVEPSGGLKDLCDEGLKGSQEEQKEVVYESVKHQAQVVAAANEKMIKSHHMNNKRNGVHKTRRNYLQIDAKKINNTTQSKRKIIMTRRNRK